MTAWPAVSRFSSRLGSACVYACLYLHILCMRTCSCTNGSTFDDKRDCIVIIYSAASMCFSPNDRYQVKGRMNERMNYTEAINLPVVNDGRWLIRVKKFTSLIWTCVRPKREKHALTWWPCALSLSQRATILSACRSTCTKLQSVDRYGCQRVPQLLEHGYCGHVLLQQQR